MRVRLKNLHWTDKRLADGTRKRYYYAWRGGPRLEGEPGTPEFMAAYEKAVREKVQPPPGTLFSILRAYQDSADFTGLADCTRADYIKHIRAIEKKFGAFPLAGLADRRSRAVFLAWRDELALKSRRQADYAFTVLARVISWAHHRGKVPANPLERPGRIYHGSRADHIWTDEDVARLLAVAGPELRLAFIMALHTGQRQGDLLRLTWKEAYKGARIRLKQSKTGVQVSIPVTATLRAALDSAPRRSPLTLTNTKGLPWTAAGFSSSWRKLCARAGITGVTFNDLRGTAVTRLAQAGFDYAEISAITGHSMGDVGRILERHYISRKALLADEAIARLEDTPGTYLSNRPTNRDGASPKLKEKPR